MITCSVCLRILSLTNAGVIHQHGPGCQGTGHLPVDGSVNNKIIESSNDTQANKHSVATHVTTDSQELIDVIRSERCRLIKRIPKASRTSTADKLSTILDRIITDPDDPALCLLRFSHACLAVPGGRGGKRHLSSLAAKVNKALDAYLSTTYDLPQQTQQFKLQRKSTTNNMTARISEKLEDGDVRGAIRLASSDDTIAPHDEGTLAALRLKHPPRRIISGDGSLFISNENNIHLPLSVVERDIVDSIKSFPAGSAGGIDGLRPQHLKDLTNAQSGEAGQRLISRLTDFANVCLSGNVPPSIRSIFCGASLCALNKKDGDIRPIAVGSTLRRLVAKTSAKCVQEKTAARMAPTQLGFGVKQGTEAAVHAARRFLQDMQPEQALLKLDFANAFNAISRDGILRTVHDELPELFPFITTCYNSA